MRCPNCGGELITQGGRFCPYCGTDLCNDININIKKESYNKTEIIDHGRIAEARADERKNRAWVSLKGLGIITILAIMVGLFIVLMNLQATKEQHRKDESAVELAEFNAHNQEMARLQAIEDEILVDIREEKYEQAIAKAKTLVYTGTYSITSKKAWDEKRQELINTLAELIKRKE